MRCLAPILSVALCLSSDGQEANTTILTLVEEEGFNELDIDLAVILGDSSASSDLSGTLNAVLNISPDTHTTSEFTITSGNLSGSDVTLSNTENAPFSSYNFSSSALMATASTPNAPGIVTPETGEFDATQHEISVNQGTLNGTVTTILTGTTNVNYNYADNPFSGSGSNTGTITLTPTTSTPTRQNYDVTVIIPITITQVISTNELPVDANVTMTGNAKATGTTFVELTETYEIWAMANGVAEAAQTDFSLSPTLPNRLVYALGFDAGNTPTEILSPANGGFALNLNGNELREPVVIEFSEDLNEWGFVPEGQIIQGQAMLPKGFSGDVVVGQFGTSGYYRVKRINSG